jgi:chaperonin cofactor prefoldin
MDETQLDDLKQFIMATISQATTDMATKNDIESLKKSMDTRFEEVQSAIAEAMSTTNDTVDEKLEDHEHRIGLLEQSAT